MRRGGVSRNLCEETGSTIERADKRRKRSFYEGDAEKVIFRIPNKVIVSSGMTNVVLKEAASDKKTQGDK